MKPNFALSLSHDGISLLHRQDGGWQPVGSVPLDSPDLAVALADLRQAGRARAAGRMTSAIIVPSDQIRFLALPGAAADDATVRAALDGATPYPVSELVYDYQQVDGTLHIAAVARETLAEAEGFAADHGFGPVGFLSEAQATGFPVGAFFGPSRIAPRLIAPGDTVERETPPGTPARESGRAAASPGMVDVVSESESAPGLGRETVSTDLAASEAGQRSEPDARRDAGRGADSVPDATSDFIPKPALESKTGSPAAEPAPATPLSAAPDPMLKPAPKAKVNSPAAEPDPATDPLSEVAPDPMPKPAPKAGLGSAAESDLATDPLSEAASDPISKTAPASGAGSAPALDRTTAPRSPAPDLISKTASASTADSTPALDPATEPRSVASDPISKSAPASGASSATAPRSAAPDPISKSAPKAGSASLAHEPDLATGSLSAAAPELMSKAGLNAAPERAPELASASPSDAASERIPKPASKPGSDSPPLEPDFASDPAPEAAPASDTTRVSDSTPVAFTPDSPVAEDLPETPVVFASRARPLRAAEAVPPAAFSLTLDPVAEGTPEPVFAHRQPALRAETPGPAAPPAPPRFAAGAATADPRVVSETGAPAGPRPPAVPPAPPRFAAPAASEPSPETRAPAVPPVPPRFAAPSAATPSDPRVAASETGALAGTRAPITLPAPPRFAAPAAAAPSTDVSFNAPDPEPPADINASAPVSPGLATQAAPRAEVPPLVAKRLAAPAWARIETPETAPATAAPRAPAARGRLRLGLVLTVVLLVVLALVALWSTSLGSGLANLFRGAGGEAAVAALPEAEAAPEAAPETAPAETPAETAAAPDPTEPPAEITAEIPGAVPDAPLDPAAVAAAATAAATGFVTPDEADRIYDATGVWLRAPRLPLMPETEDLADLATGTGDDAAPGDATVAALPTGPGMAPDAGLPAQPVPPAAGASFPRDARGLIVASPEGTLLPNGATVFAAAPPLVPPTRPGTPPPAPDAAAAVESLGIRPALRPESVLAAAVAAGLAAAPESEAAAEPAITPGAVSYAGLRPAVRPSYMVPPEPWDGPAPPNRPAGLAPDAVPDAALVPPEAEEAPPADDLDAALLAIVAGAPDPLVGVTAQAVPQARRPDARPRNFDSVVQTQLERLARAQQQQQQQAAAAAPAPAPAAPQTGGTGTGALSQEEAAEAAPEISSGESLPAGAVPGSVAQNATLAGAINLNEVNVIGVFGTQSNRRALVRLANGRILQVRVGDTLDGGQVTAIGDSFVNYTRRGQPVTLHVPG